MSDVIERAKAVLGEHVTPGPWVVNTEGWAVISSGSDSVMHGYFEGDCGNCGDRIIENASVAVSIEDAEFIAAARALVPALVDEVETLRGDLQMVKDLHQPKLIKSGDHEVETVCGECSNMATQIDWPCRTARLMYPESELAL